MSSKIKYFYDFENFRLDADNPSLWRGGETVSIPPKALELLILLVNKHGETVSRDELLETVWKDTFVEEGNINYTVSLLRKTLGEKHLIQTVPKRGYRFTAEVIRVAETAPETIVVQPKPEEIILQPTNDFSSLPANESLPLERVEQKSPRRWLLPVTALLGVVFLTSFSFLWRSDNPKSSIYGRKINAVAILPLRNLDENEQNKTLALGLTDSLISRLGSLNRFIVRPLDAVEKYAKSDKDAMRFGGELKVDAVLEGTFQTIQNRLRVNARLIDVRDGAQLWTANFDEIETDVFKLQDKISSQVANSLAKNLTAQDAQILSKKSTENPEALRAYTRGRAIFDQRIHNNFELAIAEFQKAIALDPTFALAYAGLADAFSRQGIELTGEAASEFFTKAEFYAQKALELDAESAEAYVSRGRLKRTRHWDWAGAEKDFISAINLNPNLANAHLYYAQMLSFLGRQDEALAEIDKAADINPISPIIMSGRIPILESRGEYDKAVKHAEEFIKFDTGGRSAKRALGTLFFHKGAYAKVIEMGEDILSNNGEPKFAWLSLLSTAYRRTNQMDKAETALRQLEELSQRDTKALYSLAMNYTEFNRVDEAVWTLQKCFEMREERMVWLNVEPRLANLRSDFRFQELVQKMNLK